MPALTLLAAWHARARQLGEAHQHGRLGAMRWSSKSAVLHRGLLARTKELARADGCSINKPRDELYILSSVRLVPD